MGASLTTAKVKNKVIIIGPKNSGKTTMLYRLKLGKQIEVSPSIEFNVESIKHQNKCFSIWDITANPKRPTVMTQHFGNVKAIIYVIDSSDRDKTSELKEQFEKITNHELLKHVPMIIALNKQDCNKPIGSSEINDILSLHHMNRKWWHVQPTCAASGEGLKDCFDWICGLDKHDLYIH